MKKLIFFIVFFSLLSLYFRFLINRDRGKNLSNEKIILNEKIGNNPAPIVAPESDPVIPAILPDKLINEVAFIPQAPFKIWDALHEEACEEAAILTSYYYIKNIKNPTLENIEEKIQALVTYQIKAIGSHKDLNADEMVKLAKDFYQLDLTVLDNPTIKQLKELLSEEKLIIIPTAGQVLANPNYTAPGPLYHAVVIIGYDDAAGQFITHDPGTRKGEKYRYSYQHLFDSIHDFPGKKENILQGASRVIVVDKNN